jgi:hypothetical protein
MTVDPQPMFFRPNQQFVVAGGGVQVSQPGGISEWWDSEWWDPTGAGLCVWAAYQPKGAPSLASSYTDITGNGNDCAAGSAPPWDAVNGWKFGGSHYLTTSFVPANDKSQAALVQFTNHNGASYDYLFGKWDSNDITSRFWISPKWSGDDLIYDNYGQPGTGAIAPALAAGNLGMSGNQGYRNGAADGAALVNTGGTASSAVYIGGRNKSGSPGGYITAYIQAIVFYDCTLTGAQVLAVATAMAAL